MNPSGHHFPPNSTHHSHSHSHSQSHFPPHPPPPNSSLATLSFPNSTIFHVNQMQNHSQSHNHYQYQHDQHQHQQQYPTQYSLPIQLQHPTHSHSHPYSLPIINSASTPTSTSIHTHIAEANSAIHNTPPFRQNRIPSAANSNSNAQSHSHSLADLNSAAVSAAGSLNCSSSSSSIPQNSSNSPSTSPFTSSSHSQLFPSDRDGNSNSRVTHRTHTHEKTATAQFASKNANASASVSTSTSTMELIPDSSSDVEEIPSQTSQIHSNQSNGTNSRPTRNRRSTQANQHEANADAVAAAAGEVSHFSPSADAEFSRFSLLCSYNFHLPPCDRGKCVSHPNCIADSLVNNRGIWNSGGSSVLNRVGPHPTLLVRDSASKSGLTNLGATCYMNVLMQCLFMNSSFRHSLFSYRAPDQNSSSFSCLSPLVQSRIPIVRELQKLFARLEHSRKAYQNPQEIVRQLGIQCNEQQDVNEFTNLMLQAIELGLKADQGAHRIRSLVEEEFSGELYNEVQCLTCSQTSSRPSTFLDLSLQVSGKKSVSECLKEFFAAEFLKDENKYFCSKCNSKQAAKKFSKLKRLPPVLNLQLIRFRFDWNSGAKIKLTDSILIPRRIDFNEYWMPEQTKAAAVTAESADKNIYVLTAVLRHRGASANSGHYTAEIRDDSGDWFIFDDEKVEFSGRKFNAKGDSATAKARAAPKSAEQLEKELVSQKKSEENLKKKELSAVKKRGKQGSMKAVEINLADNESESELVKGEGKEVEEGDHSRNAYMIVYTAMSRIKENAKNSGISVEESLRETRNEIIRPAAASEEICLSVSQAIAYSPVQNNHRCNIEPSILTQINEENNLFGKEIRELMEKRQSLEGRMEERRRRVKQFLNLGELIPDPMDAAKAELESDIINSHDSVDAQHRNYRSKIGSTPYFLVHDDWLRRWINGLPEVDKQEEAAGNEEFKENDNQFIEIDTEESTKSSVPANLSQRLSSIDPLWPGDLNEYNSRLRCDHGLANPASASINKMKRISQSGWTIIQQDNSEHRIKLLEQLKSMDSAFLLSPATAIDSPLSWLDLCETHAIASRIESSRLLRLFDETQKLFDSLQPFFGRQKNSFDAPDHDKYLISTHWVVNFKKQFAAAKKKKTPANEEFRDLPTDANRDIRCHHQNLAVDSAAQPRKAISRSAWEHLLLRFPKSTQFLASAPICPSCSSLHDDLAAKDLLSSALADRQRREGLRAFADPKGWKRFEFPVASKPPKIDNEKPYFLAPFNWFDKHLVPFLSHSTTVEPSKCPVRSSLLCVAHSRLKYFLSPIDYEKSGNLMGGTKLGELIIVDKPVWDSLVEFGYCSADDEIKVWVKKNRSIADGVGEGTWDAIEISSEPTTCWECVAAATKVAESLKFDFTAGAISVMRIADNIPIPEENSQSQIEPQNETAEANPTHNRTLRRRANRSGEHHLVSPVSANDTIAHFKMNLCQYVSGFPLPGQIRLFFRGQELRDDQTIKAYRIADHAELLMKVKANGGDAGEASLAEYLIFDEKPANKKAETGFRGTLIGSSFEQKGSAESNAAAAAVSVSIRVEEEIKAAEKMKKEAEQRDHDLAKEFAAEEQRASRNEQYLSDERIAASYAQSNSESDFVDDQNDDDGDGKRKKKKRKSITAKGKNKKPKI